MSSPKSPSAESAWSALGAELISFGVLEEALRAERPLMAAIFAFDRASSSYALSSAVGFAHALVESVRPRLVFPFGEERGLVGLVASRREPLYVPDCAAEPRWVGEGRTVPIASAYLAPVVSGESVPAVVCIFAPSVAAIPPEQRALLDWLADFSGRMHELEVGIRARLGRIEREMRTVALEWAELRDALAAELPGEVRTRLRSLSPREWQVVERLHSGARIATIASELKISPNTVRNHVKSISRKLGVRSQDELRERIGALSLGMWVPWRGE